MIIKGLFRRYERWNPVHPTYGAFWGMGFGIGCGVGWGPGFGPDVVGYVGAGCGIGFSVGITLAGVGIGLPANCLYKLTYDVIMATRAGAIDFAQSDNLRSAKRIAEDRWNNIAPFVSGLQREAKGRLSSVQQICISSKGPSLCDVKGFTSTHALTFWERLEAFGGRIFRPYKGPKD